MNILITGGAGYIGTELIEQLLLRENVERIIVYDNLSNGNYNLFLAHALMTKKVQFVKGDLLDTAKLDRTLKKEKINVVYHLAAKVSTPFAMEAPHFFEQVNHWGSAELSYLLEKNNITQLIYLSSASVYGSSEEAFDEQKVPNPKRAYPLSKYRAELMFERLNKKMKVFIIRCGNVYGYSRSMRFDAVINKFVFNAHFLRTININGNGKQTRPFIHIKKVVKVLNAILDKDLVEGGTYNLVDKNLDILTIAHTLKDIYEDLNIIFIAQDISMNSLKVKPNIPFNELGFSSNEPFILEEQLLTFKSQFSF